MRHEGPKMRVGVILAAAGRGERMGHRIPKQFLELAGVPVYLHSLRVFEDHPRVEEIVLAVPPGWETRVLAQVRDLGLFKVKEVVCGGDTRQASVERALRALSAGIDTVLVHDAARPLISRELVSRVLQALERYGAVLCAVPVRDTVKLVREGRVERTIPREGLWLAQTPQGARREWLEEAYRLAGQRMFTDEAALLEAAGFEVRVVRGENTNLKITYPEDFRMAEIYLRLDKPGKV